MPIPIKKFDCLYSNFGLLPLGVNILFNPSSKQDTVEIWDILRDHDCYLTEKEIESKITKLQDEGVIKQYTITVDTKKLRHRIIRIALVRLRVSQHLDFIPAREASFQTLTHTSKEYRKFLDEYVIPFLGRR